MANGVRFDGKVILVTGSSSGLGAATVERFLAEGAIVVGSDIQPPVEGAVAPTTFTMVDVTDEAAVAAWVAEARAHTGRIDAVCTYAGIPAGGPVHLVDLESWQRTIDINLTGTFLTCKHVIAAMLGQEPIDGERGSVITVASVEGLEGTAGGSSYNASKGGVAILTKNMAIDYGRQGIRVNAICPGFIDSPWFDKLGYPGGAAALREHIAKTTPLKAASTPEDIAGSALFLGSEAARHVTGETLLVDAGLHLNV